MKIKGREKEIQKTIIALNALGKQPTENYIKIEFHI